MKGRRVGHYLDCRCRGCKKPTNSKTAIKARRYHKKRVRRLYRRMMKAAQDER